MVRLLFSQAFSRKISSYTQDDAAWYKIKYLISNPSFLDLAEKLFNKRFRNTDLFTVIPQTGTSFMDSMVEDYNKILDKILSIEEGLTKYLNITDK